MVEITIALLKPFSPSSKMMQLYPNVWLIVSNDGNEIKLRNIDNPDDIKTFPCEDVCIAIMQVESTLYKVVIFDEDNSKYKDITNQWYIYVRLKDDKVSLYNPVERVSISSISILKIAEID